MRRAKSTTLAPATLRAVASTSIAGSHHDAGAEFAAAVTRFANRGARLAAMEVREMADRGLAFDIVLQSLVSARLFSLVFDNSGPVPGSFRSRAVVPPIETRFYRGERSLLTTLARGRPVALTYEISDYFLATADERGGARINPEDYIAVIRTEVGVQSARAHRPRRSGVLRRSPK